jgi:CBS domain containing-hemolysin-like protein
VWTEWIFKPAIWALNGAGNALLRLAGIEPASGHELVHSVEELKMLIRASAAGGVVEDDAREMVTAVFDFGELLVRQVMVPRTEMVAVQENTGIEELLELAVQHPFSKFPVYAESQDQILGVVHLKDVLLRTNGEQQSLCARDLMREAIFIPETARVNTLLRLFRASRRHIAIVVDEYGGTAGIVTLDDLLEEIVGEVSDPFDEEPDVQSLPDGTMLVDGLTLIEEVNDHFDLNLVDPNYDTIAGYVLGRLERLARIGDIIVVDGARIKVEAMDGFRVARVSIQPLPKRGSKQAPFNPEYAHAQVRRGCD